MPEETPKTNHLSVLARFDDFCRRVVSQNTKFSQYHDLKHLVAQTDDLRKKWQHAELELQEAKKLIFELTERNKELEAKLHRMRQAYGLEMYKAQDYQKENEKLRSLLGLIRQTVNNDVTPVNKESKEMADSSCSLSDHIEHDFDSNTEQSH